MAEYHPTRIRTNDAYGPRTVPVRRSKLSGREAITDIPEYIRRDMVIDFLDAKASYPIEGMFGVTLVLDFADMISDAGYAGNARPGTVLPPGFISLIYNVPKAVGNQANHRSTVSIERRYPSKAELDELLGKMSETCTMWDEELLSEMEEFGIADYLREDFRDSYSTVKDLTPKIAAVVNDALEDLFIRLDKVARDEISKFHRGHRFGYRDVEQM